MENKIKVIVLNPDVEAEVIEIENTLSAFQKGVGGYIECIYPFDDPITIICNEEGKYQNFKMTRSLRDEDGKRYDILMGTCYIAGIIDPETDEDDGNFHSLSEELITKYMKIFGEPELELIIGNFL